ncbi:hypothetical protein BC343_12650 [Mucilaginibacter pedocola]|uniref:Uncharacterized protein n=1 Tax=Mucilaginibacter pedocola TaxID=1792845 RepID=A0A1S9P9I7_9SPHI|nr:hypothetical protein BC343_12650 [Mucilaginibacter pedocola]
MFVFVNCIAFAFSNIKANAINPMKLFKYFVILLAGSALLSSCGLFKKDCGCPHFGMRKATVSVNRA